MKIRLDKALVERGLLVAERAQALVLAGRCWWRSSVWKSRGRPSRKTPRCGCWAKTCAT